MYETDFRADFIEQYYDTQQEFEAAARVLSVVGDIKGMRVDYSLSYDRTRGHAIYKIIIRRLDL